MALLAVSFCNHQSSSDPSLVILDDESAEHHSVPIADDIVSASGLAHDGKHLYCAYTTPQGSFLTVFDRIGAVALERVKLHAVKDVHSITVDDKSVIAISTGNDTVVRVDLATTRSEVVWRASTSNLDTHHINSVVWHDGRLLCSAFGRKHGQAWSDALDGYIFDISGLAYLRRGIYHPHSLVSFEGSLYYCASSEGVFRSLEREVAYLPGYARGAAIDTAGRYYAGSSAARRGSTQRHFFLNPADQGADAGRCAIVMGSLHRRDYRTIFLDEVGREIYDLLLLDPRVE